MTKSESIFNTDLALLWPKFVDQKKRMETMQPFLDKIFVQNNQNIILDAGMGMGSESIYLKKKGFHIISNELDQNLINIAQSEAHRHGLVLDVISEDWRDLDNWQYLQKFSSIFLFGNSLCLLPDYESVLQSLRAFYNCLETGGKLVIDERNFTYILSHRTDILNGKFRYSGKYLYCGNEIKGRPISIQDNNIVFGYFREKKIIGRLNMLPFGKDEMFDLLTECGFKNIIQYSDFKPGYDEKADFYTYIAER